MKTFPLNEMLNLHVSPIGDDHWSGKLTVPVPKAEIARGPQHIDRILEPVAAVLKTGGYIPFGDHFIPPDVSWNDFSYYRGKLNSLIDRYGGQQSPGPAKLTMELGWDEDSN